MNIDERCIRLQLTDVASTCKFSDDLDLWDESLREGAERSLISPSTESKLELARDISGIGIKTIVVGMFPDVPHNVALLSSLIDAQDSGEIGRNVRFIVITHVGITFQQTVDTLGGMNRRLNNVWVMCIHSVSDEQIKHLFPMIVNKDPLSTLSISEWNSSSTSERRLANLDYLNGFVDSAKEYKGGGVIFGLLDAFRSDLAHLNNVISLLDDKGITQIRLVDTAGSCIPQQLNSYVGSIVQSFPDVSFYGHFHNDFGLATSNALIGLSMGLKGVDVSVSGVANRAGHPPLAEVAYALFELYGITLADFKYDELYPLSRKIEDLYGLMESPVAPVTGVMTNSVLMGIRTELVDRSPAIFDIIDADFVGSPSHRLYGVRTGLDGLERIIRRIQKESPDIFGREVSGDLIESIYMRIDDEWKKRSQHLKTNLDLNIRKYHDLINLSSFSEDEVVTIVKEYINLPETLV